MQYTVLLLGLLLIWSSPARSQEAAATHGEGMVTHEIGYLPDDGSEVFLAWKPTNGSVADAGALNPGTRTVDKLLYTPMVREGKEFRATITLTEGTNYYYCFWVTKNRQGDYLNLWDLKASGNRTSGDAAYLSVTGFSSEANDTTPTEGWHPAWLVAALLIAGYWIFARRSARTSQPSPHRRILSTGLALAAVHVLARAAILGIGVRAAYQYPLVSLKKLVAGSAADLTFVGGLTALALLVLAVLYARRAGHKVATGFTVVALLATFAAIVNVAAVNYIGHPFTYQWMYYSGFLLGSDALEALRENTTPATLVDLVAYPLILVLGARCLSLAGRAFSFAPLSVALIVLVVSSNYAASLFGEGTYGGLTGNGVTTFAGSLVSADELNSFASQSLTPEQHNFQELTAPLYPGLVADTLRGQVKNLLFIVLESAGDVYFNRFSEAIDPAAPLATVRDRSLTYRNFYAHSPSTNVSLVSMLSGIYPLPSYRSVTRESPEMVFPTLASVLSAEGYRTSFMTSADNDWLSTLEYLKAREFDVVEDYRLIPCDQNFRMDDGQYQESSAVDDSCLTDRFVDWINQEPDRPFFSVLWTVQGHYPYYFAGEQADYGVESFLHNRYLNAVRHGTETVVDVLGALQLAGLDSSTLVVLTGDHGEAFGQHGHHGHGNTLHEEDLRVPLYFINPLLFHGEEHEGLGATKDLAPTALSLLGIDPPVQWQGRDLLSTSGEEGFYFAPWTNLYFGYRRGNKKYIFNETTATLRVFDLADDPRERHDLSAQTPAAEIDSVRLRIAAWAQQQDEFYKAIH